MHQRQRRLLTTYAIIHGGTELTFIPLITLSFCLCLNLTWSLSLQVLGIVLGVGLIRNATMIVCLRKSAAPFIHYLTHDVSELSHKELQRAFECLRRSERVYLWILVPFWTASLIIALFVLKLQGLTLDPIAPTVCAAMALTTLFGTLGLGPLLMCLVRILNGSKLSQEMSERGLISSALTEHNLVFKTVWTVVFVTLTSIAWLSCLVVKIDFERDKYEAIQEHRISSPVQFKTQFLSTAQQRAEQPPKNAVNAGQEIATAQLATKQGQAELNQWKSQIANAKFWAKVQDQIRNNQEFATIIPGQTEILQLQQTNKGLILTRKAWQSWESDKFFVSSTFFVCVLFIFCLKSALCFIFQLVRPLRDFNNFCSRFLQQGKIREMPFIPGYYADEVGSLIATFNLVLTELKQFVQQTSTIARGDLSIKVEGQGDLPDSFETMVDSLNRSVTSVTQDSNDLHSIGRDLLKSAQDQESLSSEQYNSVYSINELASSLDDAANQVAEQVHNIAQSATDSVRGAQSVLQNVSTLSDQMTVVKRATQGIRTIAKRSRLLAINARIEANRLKDQNQSITALAEEAKSQSEKIEEVTTKLEEWLEDIRAFTQISTNSSIASKKLASSTLDAANNVSHIMSQQLQSTQQLTSILGQTVKKIIQTQNNAENTRQVAETLVFKSNTLQKRVDAFTLAEA